MSPKDLQSQIALGEDSKRQFKADVRNAESVKSQTLNTYRELMKLGKSA